MILARDAADAEDVRFRGSQGRVPLGCRVVIHDGDVSHVGAYKVVGHDLIDHAVKLTKRGFGVGCKVVSGPRKLLEVESEETGDRHWTNDFFVRPLRVEPSAAYWIANELAKARAADEDTP